MFDYDYTESKHFTRKADKENAFFEWLKAVGIERDAFPFDIDAHRFYKDKPVHYKVVSWGSYMSSAGVWVIFIAYEFRPMKHTIQYSWRAGRDGKVSGQSTKNEWIN